MKLYKSDNFISARKLKFFYVGKNFVYNITSPFKFKENYYLFARLEPKSSEDFSSKIVLFKKRDSVYWDLDKEFEHLNLEDPFFKKIKGLWVLGGVEVKRNIAKKKINYKTVFYKGDNPYNLKKFSTGPWGMKDIRLIELPDEKIGVFTRPQGKKGGRGKIGFTIINSLDDLKPRKLSRAPLLDKQFSRGEWGGVNDVVILKNGTLGVLGHIARYSKDKKNRFYYAIVFCFNYNTRKSSNLRLILRRAELPEGEAKEPGLYNVIFPGGILRKKDGNALIYAGVGDAESYQVLIKDPFEYYEKGN